MSKDLIEEYEIARKKTKEILDSSIKSIVDNFPDKKGLELDIILYIASTNMRTVQLDAEKMDFKDFYKKYLKGTLFLDSTDFTNSEKEIIIKESPLSERDRNLARMYWVAYKSEDEIANELMIDRKTVRNNIPKISLILKRTAMILYK